MIQGLQAAIAGVMPAALSTGLFASTITIMQPTGVLGPSGAPLQPPAGFESVTGLVGIPCQAAPLAPNKIEATEMRELEQIIASQPLHILLNGWYPQIEGGVANGWLAVIENVYYIILGAESDSQGQMTRLEVKLVGV
jgi:hypothetical protein